MDSASVACELTQFSVEQNLRKIPGNFRKTGKNGLIPADFSFHHLEVCQPFFQWRVGREELHEGIA
jgi:hypothetical protein